MNIKISTTIFVKWRLFKQRKGNEFHHRSLLQIIRCREVVQSRFWIVLKQRLKEPKMSWAFSVRLDSTLCPLKSIPFSERCVCSSKMFTIFYLCWLFFRQALLGFFFQEFSLIISSMKQSYLRNLFTLFLCIFFRNSIWGSSGSLFCCLLKHVI